MILDKLLEKKDLLIYIDKRIEHLEKQKERILGTHSSKKREGVRERFYGRIIELQYLKKHIVDIKDTAKRYWLDCYNDSSLELEKTEEE